MKPVESSTISHIDHADGLPTSMPVPQATSSNQLLAVLSRMMADPSVDIERIERGAALYERALARDMETAFNQAMRDAQSEMRPIAALANNPQTKSKYAKYDALDNAVRPIYSKHGFSLSFYQGEGAPSDHIRVQCKLSCGGHTERPYLDMPADGKGAKGGDAMTKTHATGAGVTYGRRYLLGMIFNLVIGEDHDGNDAMPGEAISQEQLVELIQLADEHSVDKQKFCAYMKTPSLAELPARQFKRACDAIRAKKRAAK
jgi:ERF superfamily protein